ncbi:MAG TPA: hypothetical protein VGZ47_14500 [Gemmataceae bacterium]|jgi:chromosome segregation ATPase|nr:hypothetical protein [Gemmataceae bacterium]
MDTEVQSPSPQPNPETWRIQAAALAAEQIALIEWEDKLHDRQAELEREEAEIAARLEEKLRQVASLQEQLSQGRDQLRQEREELNKQKKAVEAAKRQVQAEREQLEREQDNLQQRWNKCIRQFKQKIGRWKTYRDRSTAALLAKTAELDKQRQTAKTNAEQETARLQQAWQHLENEKARFQAEQQKATEQNEAQQRLARALNEEQQHWRSERKELEAQCNELRAEARELQSQIISARKLLPAAGMPHTASTPPGTNQASAEAVPELESLTVRLQQEEDHLAEQHRELAERSDQLRRQREIVYRQQRDVENRVAQCSLRELQWQAEQKRAQADVRDQERQLHLRESALADLVRRTQQRRRNEIAQFHEIIRASEKMQEHWARQVEEYCGRCQALREAQQAHAEQALALEQARAELLEHADDSGFAAKRVERLRRRWKNLSAKPLREAGKQWKALQEEQARWWETLAHLRQEMESLVQRERELAGREAEAEAFRRRLDEQAEEQELLQVRWQEQEQSYQQQLAALREELERLVNGENAGATSDVERVAA